MDEKIEKYLALFQKTTRNRFGELYNLLRDSVKTEVEEKMWARLPSFYREDRFIRLIPFENHINVEAKAILTHKDKLLTYKITPKGMLQIRHDQEILVDALTLIFHESLER